MPSWLPPTRRRARTGSPAAPRETSTRWTRTERRAPGRPCHECGGTVADGRLLHPVRGEGPQPARPLHRAAGDLGGRRRVTAAYATAATRTRWRSTPMPEPGSRAVLVVCDGVSTSTDSDVASLAAARAARDVLVRATSARHRHRRRPGRRHREGARRGHGRGQRRRRSRTPRPGPGNPASCTFVAGGGRRVPARRRAGSATAAPTGSRTTGRAAAALRRRLLRRRADRRRGRPAPRPRAGPQAHAITRWLGSDAPDHARARPRWTWTAPGWVLVCSDGLWNYCSEPADLAALVQELAPTPPDPLALADALVDWANAQGGIDNITVALGPDRPVATAPARPAQTREEAPRWQRSQLRSSRTSSSPTAGATCTRSSRSPARAPARPGKSGAGDAGEIVIVDTSGSMGADKILAAQQAAAAALDQVLDGVWFAVIAGSHEAQAGVPGRGPAAWCGWTTQTRAAPSTRSAASCPRAARPWAPGCALATQVFAAVPGAGAEARDPADRRHQPARDTRAADRRDRGRPRPVPVRLPRRRLRLAGRGGTPDRHRPARQRRPDRRRRTRWPPTSRRSCAQAMGRGVAEAWLRVWAPQGAQVLFVRQVSPTVDDLTAPAHRGQRADLGVPDRLLGRRGPRLPRGRPAGGQGRRPGAARGTGAARRRRRRSWRRDWSRRCGPATTP